jgi:hypothetical protein
MCVHYIDGIPVDRARVGRTTSYHPLMGGPNMAERAIMCFTEETPISLDTFYVYMPVGGDVRTVAKTLESVRLPAGSFTSALDPGEIAAEFVKQHRTKYPKTKLTANLKKHSWDTDIVYTVNVKNITVNVQEVHLGKIDTKSLFSGTVEYFYKWADVSRLLQDAIDKVVRFTYKGGSGTGERLVKLTSVHGTGNGTILRGWDIKKSTADTPAYRTYRIGNIVGNVEVIG